MPYCFFHRAVIRSLVPCYVLTLMFLAVPHCFIEFAGELTSGSLPKNILNASLVAGQHYYSPACPPSNAPLLHHCHLLFPGTRRQTPSANCSTHRNQPQALCVLTSLLGSSSTPMTDVMSCLQANIKSGPEKEAVAVEEVIKMKADCTEQKMH
ncbi:hypothetical protein AMECASPLE_035091 [Ameca splendens]|uniref:Secreted protein n=1 Tax=Ameca splendens TaxID=208324 RepID=A0ABV0Y7Y6_9TELE